MQYPTLKDHVYNKNVERDLLNWIVTIPTMSHTMKCTKWCKQSCSYKWAWWFDVNNCYIGFESFQEYNWFKLVHFDVIN